MKLSNPLAEITKNRDRNDDELYVQAVGVPHSPVTTNMIKDPMEAKLLPLRSFQSVAYAKLWLNGYVLKRRFTKYTDCRGKFRFLNGKTGVELTKKERIDLPLLF